MKKAINQWSFPDSMSTVECMELAKSAGFDAIELILGDSPDVIRGDVSGVDSALGIGLYRNDELNLETDAEGMRSLARESEQVGIRVCSVATCLNFRYALTDRDPAVRAKGLRLLERSIQAASILGADTVLVIPAVVTESVSYVEAMDTSRRVLSELEKAARGAGVCLGIENVWNNFLLSPLELRDYIDSFGSRWVGAYFDVGNCVRTGFPEQWIELLGSRIRKVHVKDFRRSVGNIEGFVGLFEGDVNWRAVMRALARVGYDGHVVAEILPPYRDCPERLAYQVSDSLDALLNLT